MSPPLRQSVGPAVVLVLMTTICCFASQTLKEPLAPSAIIPAQSALPHYAEIMKILSDLEYDGIQAMSRPDVTLTVDYHQKTWTLHHIHQYNQQGYVQLEQGHYGLCAKLTQYVYDRIYPILKDDYVIKFAQTEEPTFFSTGTSSHYILALIRKSDSEIYLIDPSFHKYGTQKDFAKYRFMDIKDGLAMFMNRNSNMTYEIGQARPLFIRNGLLVSFSLQSVNGKFDKDNVVFAISVDRGDEVKPRNVWVVGRCQGALRVLAATALMDYMNSEERQMLYGKFMTWLKEI
ncbi:MAG: hypothetical protein HQL24_08705 [Candidatus Omnitrophica bacterium]|nr:hypothetical protein [Candidatus Omnitrophota bacterium]